MKRRRTIFMAVAALVACIVLLAAAPTLFEGLAPSPVSPSDAPAGEAVTVLESLAVKGRAPKTGYARDQFGSGWSTTNGCDSRNIILYRDLEQSVLDEKCRVQSGLLHDPYTGKDIQFSRSDSSRVQIDHVVALSDAWQKGAQQLSPDERERLANDPLELIAADGDANRKKGDGDATTWLPENKGFRCQYVARQIAVKLKYHLWVTGAEKDAISRVLLSCPSEPLPVQ